MRSLLANWVIQICGYRSLDKDIQHLYISSFVSFRFVGSSCSTFCAMADAMLVYSVVQYCISNFHDVLDECRKCSCTFLCNSAKCCSYASFSLQTNFTLYWKFNLDFIGDPKTDYCCKESIAQSGRKAENLIRIRVDSFVSRWYRRRLLLLHFILS